MDLTAIITAVIALIGSVFVVIRQQYRTPAQKDKDVLSNYADLLAQYRIRSLEQEKELARLEAEMRQDSEARLIAEANYEAVLKKRSIECDDEVNRLKKELAAYQIGYAKLRRVAVQYVPSDVALPEVNGKTTKDFPK